jgi:hypothetical protein
MDKRNRNQNSLRIRSNPDLPLSVSVERPMTFLVRKVTQRRAGENWKNKVVGF